MPFGRDLAPGMLHRHAAHNEAAARITWCIAERADRHDNGRSRGRQDASRYAPSWPASTPPGTPSSTCRNPMIGVRGLHEMIVATFGGQPDRSDSRLTAQACAILAAERDERGQNPRPGHRLYRP